jgi:hypothetical protein
VLQYLPDQDVLAGKYFQAVEALLMMLVYQEEALGHLPFCR